jgi:hypothetical protein
MTDWAAQPARAPPALEIHFRHFFHRHGHVRHDFAM